MMRYLCVLLFCAWMVPPNMPVARRVAYFQTVNGPMPVKDLRKALIHEHIVTNFAGAAAYMAPPADQQPAVDSALPALQALYGKGFNLLVECTPAFIGKDLRLLHRLSQQSRVQIMTNTGLYAAVDRKYLPGYVYSENATQLAQRWINDFRLGMDGIKPGFIKLGVGEGALDSIETKLLIAGIITSKETGMTIAVHTGDALAADDEYRQVVANGLSPNKLVWVHAQMATDRERASMATKGVWISMDNVNEKDIDNYVRSVLYLKERNLLHRLLLSHDNGFSVVKNGSYQVLEQFDGGRNMPYRSIPDLLIPSLRRKGITEAELDLVFRQNVIACYALDSGK